MDLQKSIAAPTAINSDMKPISISIAPATISSAITNNPTSKLVSTASSTDIATAKSSATGGGFVLPVVTPTGEIKETVQCDGKDEAIIMTPALISNKNNDDTLGATTGSTSATTTTASASITNPELKTLKPPPPKAMLPAPMPHSSTGGGKKLGAAIHAAASIYGRKVPAPILPLPQGVTIPSCIDPMKASAAHPMNAVKPSVVTKGKAGPARLNKFVRRLHDMLQAEKDSGIVEWRKGLLVLHSTAAFATKVLPKYFNTKNFKTFRRQLNYYGFVHVRSFSATGSTTTALWVNQELAKSEKSTCISSVLQLKRVEPSDTTRTAEGRRVRKEEAAHTVEDIGITTKSLQMDQIRSLTKHNLHSDSSSNFSSSTSMIVHSHTADMTCTTVMSTVPNNQMNEIDFEEMGSPIANHTTNDAANLLLALSKSIQT